MTLAWEWDNKATRPRGCKPLWHPCWVIHSTLFRSEPGCIRWTLVRSKLQPHNPVIHSGNRCVWHSWYSKAVLRIRDVWYGSGPAPLTNGSGLKLHNSYHFSKIKVTKKLSSFFLIFLLDDRRIPIGSVPNGSRSGKQKDPTDPDPQHCSKWTAFG